MRPGRGSALGPQSSGSAWSRRPRPVHPDRAARRWPAVAWSIAPALASGPTTWQLTDRGIAVVLVTILMIVIAAVAVIGLTALRVTGDSYQGYGQSQSALR